MAFDPNKITYFAKTDARGKNVQFGIKAKDRQRHMYVIGKTGMGKSTLLENMAVQDIQNGEGMAFIDPHGSAAETLLNYIPEHRIKDVLYFAPFDTDHPVSFNIMEDVGVDKRHLVVSGLMSVFEKIWIDAWSARMAYILQNTLMALLETPGSTLLGVNRMLSDKDYRNMVIANVQDPGVRSFWVDEFAKYNERYMQEAGDAIKNKIGQFTANPIIRNIIGQPKSSFDIREIMDEKKILIMNLSKGLIGETNANLLGSMLTTRIYLAAMSRADLPPEKMREMPNFYFYVDEFQSFANATFANILSEARKYHLNLTIAHQYIEQMEEEVRSAVFGNVGTIIAFRVGPFDAEVLETIFTPQFLATDIVNLSFAQIYLTLMIDGIGSQPFSAETLPPIAPPAISRKQMAIVASRERFTRLRPEVEEEIRKFHEPIVVPRKTERTDTVSSSSSLTPERRRPAGEYPRRTGSESVNGGANRTRESISPQSESRESSRLQPSVSYQKTADVSGKRVHTHTEEIPIGKVSPPQSSEVQREFSSEKRESVPSVPHKRNERTVHTPPKQLQTQVEDLRSILKRVVEVSKQDDNAVPVIKEETVNRSALKDALGSILTQEKNPPAQQTPLREKEEVRVGVTTDFDETSTHEVPVYIKKQPEEQQPRHANSSPARASLPPQKTRQKSSPAPTPQELERMMRVTTSDKPPLQ